MAKMSALEALGHDAKIEELTVALKELAVNVEKERNDQKDRDSAMQTRMK